MEDQDSTQQPGLRQQLREFVQDYEMLSADGANKLDRKFRARLATLTSGTSPMELLLAYTDWLGHLSLSPGKQLRLWQSLVRKLIQFGFLGADAAGRSVGDIIKLIKGSNSKRGLLATLPFELLPQSHALIKEWWQEAVTDVDGASAHHLEFVGFINEQILEALSPANSPLINPEFLSKTFSERGRNIKRGLGNFLGDRLGKPNAKASNYQVGKDVAITPGEVIYQNALIELIQYSPSTETVSKEPVLIVPPWIMKYYILDLSPENSLVKYLVDQGKTVFMISWKNPEETDREVAFNDYLTEGFLPALRGVQAVVPKTPVNAVGYCIGGTLLLMGAALLAREDDNSLNSLSLFASQADFSEAGDIKRLLSDSQLSFLKAIMWKKGFLPAKSMGGAFAALRPAELIWQPVQKRYFLGEDGFMNDLMTWNADGTRMPYRMHSEYLQKLYLDNALAEGCYEVDDQAIFLTDIKVPIFSVGTEKDHVAPWKSVYKLHRLTHTELTFLLTSGGHNAGIISGPSHPRRTHRISTRGVDDLHLDAQTWLAQTQEHVGSWWPVWYKWLDEHSGDERAPPSMGAARKGYKPLRDAPGEYILG